MKINTAPLGKFGNMTSGDGLAAAFNDDILVGYAQGNTGWAGVTFSSPSTVDKAIATSADNGFDASGLTSNITLKLYAKQGSAPISPTDGILLGSVSFTDVNSVRSIEIPSSDKSTKFDHAWLVVTTGVWAILQALEIHDAAPTPTIEYEALGDGRHVFVKSCNDSAPLIHNGAELQQHRIAFLIDDPRVVQIDYHADVTHEGSRSIFTNGVADADIAVGYSFSLTVRSGASESAMRSCSLSFISNAVGGGNVSERSPQHYGNKTICSAIELPAGYHEISVFVSGHTDGTSTQGILKMLVEGGKGLNALRVSVEPVGTVFHG